MSPCFTASEIAGRSGLKRYALAKAIAHAIRPSASASFLADEPVRVAPSSVADAAHGAR